MYRGRYSFFGLTPEYKLSLQKQIFELSYHSNGAINVNIAYQLPVYLRNFYYRELANIKEKEAESYKSPTNNQNKIHRPF